MDYTGMFSNAPAPMRADSAGLLVREVNPKQPLLLDATASESEGPVLVLDKGKHFPRKV